MNFTTPHFVYRLYGRGTRTLCGAVSTWCEDSAAMLRRANALYSQGFDVEVAYGGKTICHTIK